MRIVIYESSSFGGCYDYAHELAKAYVQHENIEQVELLLPENSESLQQNAHKVLLSDEVVGGNILKRKWMFLWRQFANPFVLFGYLRKLPSAVVLLNDFEQLSSFLWAPLFRLFLRKHTFAVFLHDPDRDAYPPSARISGWQMSWMMRVMDLGFYHELLPDKWYYKLNTRTKYVALPHGIYPAHSEDVQFSDFLKEEKGERFAFALIGNIRAEKNVDLAIRSLVLAPDIHLFITGRAANTSVSISAYKDIADDLGVSDRITWVNRFLSYQEMSSVIKTTDAVLLYYSATFVSQSAIINQVAPFKKPLLVSNTESALTATVRKFKNALLVEPDNVELLAEGMCALKKEPEGYVVAWEEYLKYASWKTNCDMAVQAFLGIDQ